MAPVKSQQEVIAVKLSRVKAYHVSWHCLFRRRSLELQRPNKYNESTLKNVTISNKNARKINLTFFTRNTESRLSQT